ncbi:carboxypeptidase regulatory-like domain-containing protein, partial [Candidatus Sumerlaeota bacterium]|nr:carboxypeptidase regulatory-like domain-containing protein [Candidatus Sumerlaeota bacterium]
MKKILEIFLVIVIVLIMSWGAVLLLSQKPLKEETASPSISGEFAAPLPFPAVPMPSLEEPVRDIRKEQSRNESRVLFSGRVVDEQGNPAPGVSLRLYRHQDLFFKFDLMDERLSFVDPGHETVSNARGDFLLQDFPEGIFRLEVKSTEYANYWMAPSFSIKKGIPFTDMEIVVHKGEPLKGIVLNPAGEPVPDARVFYSMQGEISTFYDQAFSGNEGHFIFPHIPPGKNLSIMASKKGFAPVVLYPLPTPRSSSELLEIELSDPISLEGRVFSSDGAPAANAEILPKVTVKAGEEKRILGFAPVKSDEQGIFKLNDLPPGDLRLLVRGNAGDRTHEKNLKLEAGSIQPELTIQLQKGNSISGVVVDDTGTTLSGALVYFHGMDIFNSAITGKDGVFNLSGVGEGKKNIFALAHDKALVKITDVEPGTGNLSIVLHSGASVTGTVCAQSTNQPLKNARISVLSGDLRSPESITNRLGIYQAHFLPEANSASLMASAKGFASAKSRDLDLKPGSSHIVDFFLRIGGSISGHVWEEGTGIPIQGVSVHDFSPHYFEPIHTDENGFFRAEHIPSGSESLSVTREGYITPRARQFLIKEGE